MCWAHGGVLNSEEKQAMLRTLMCLLFGSLLLTNTSAALADEYDGTLDLFESSPTLKPFFDSAYGYVVFPLVGKGGFILGGTYGNGRVYRNQVYVGDARLRGLNLGFQLGGQTLSKIIFLQDQRAFEEFTQSGVEFDASTSVVFIAVGAQAQTGTGGSSLSGSAGFSRTAQAEYGYTKGMAIFVHSLGGLMYEASVGGQKITYEAAEE